MELARHNRCISESCNRIIGYTWSHSQSLIWRNPIFREHIKVEETGFKYRGGLKPEGNDPITREFLEPLKSKTKASPVHASETSTPSSKFLELTFEGLNSFGDAKEHSRADDEAGMRVLSGPLFNAFSFDSGSLNSNNASSISLISQCLARVRPSSNHFADLAEDLFEKTRIDEWLHGYFQTGAFDGTWMAVICGFYQSLYLYHTHSSASNEKTVVLMLRLQHLQAFQHIVANRLQEHPFKQMFKLLGSSEFLNSCLFDSLGHTQYDLRRWVEHVSNCTLCEEIFFLDRTLIFKFMHLAHILPRMFTSKEDKWLWKHLHCLDETSDVIDLTIIASLHQGLYLYGENNDHTKTKVMAEGRLTALLFRSHHLKHFVRIWSPTLQGDPFSYSILGVLNISSFSSVENALFKSSQKMIETVREANDPFLQGRFVAPSSSQKEKNARHGYGDVSSSHGPITIFLGPKCLQDYHQLSTIEDPIDLKLVHVLGGLICTIEGASTTSSSGNGPACSSWCIVRHTATNLFFCVDLKNDVYDNKNRILDGETPVDFEGVIEVEITDGKTSVRSLESDGSSFDGCLEDFVDMRGHKKAPTSCAEEALHNLPQSDCMKEYNLKCSALHMFALAFSAGNKDCLALKWEGGVGHIEYHCTGSSDQAQGTPDVALQKCTVLYTNEGRLIGEDIIWEGDCLERNTDLQDRKQKSICKNTAEGENTRGKTMKEEAILDDESDKVCIILEHCKSWSRCGLTGDYSTMHEDEIRTSLIKARKEAEGDLMSVEAASASAQMKQNSGGGIGAGTFKLQGNHEYRPREANQIIRKFLRQTHLKHHLKTTVVVPRNLHNNTFNNLKALLMSGRIGTHSREFFILKTEGSCSLQVFLCDPNDYFQKCIWLTDIVMPDARVAEEIFNEKLKGKSLTICREDSELFIDLDVARNPLFRFLQKKGKRQLVTEENMIHKDQLQNFPPSRDTWEFIIGDRREFKGRNYFLKATEYGAIVCSATIYTTGGATVRMEEKISDTSQLSTSLNSLQQIYDTSQLSSSSNSQQLINCLIHGSCEKVCSSLFETQKDKVTTVGKFSTFKAPSYWPHVYWG